MQMREIRARVAEYFKLHPPLHLFSTSLPKQERGITPDSYILNLFMLITIIYSCGTRMLKILFCHMITDSALLFLLVKIPDVMDIVIAKLNQVCIYTVPKYYTFTKVNLSFIAGVRKEYFIGNVLGDINQWGFCKGKVRLSNQQELLGY